MAETVSFEAPANPSLNEIYRVLDGKIDQQEFLVRVEKDFGDYDKSDVFVQTQEYNFFLYRNGGTFHGNPLEGDEEVLEYVENAYDISLQEELG